MIEAIIFDCWRTLFHGKTKPPIIERIAHMLGRTLEDYSYVKIFEKSTMLKKYGNWGSLFQSLLKGLEMRADKSLIQELSSIAEKGANNLIPYPNVLKTLEKLKQKYKLGLITNTNNLAFGKLKKQYNLKDYFDVMVVSYETGIIKPDPKVFQLALKKLNANKNEAIMVGDSLKDDVQAAEKLGIKGILIDRKNKYPDYPNRITSVAQLWKFL